MSNNEETTTETTYSKMKAISFKIKVFVWKSVIVFVLIKKHVRSKLSAGPDPEKKRTTHLIIMKMFTFTLSVTQ